MSNTPDWIAEITKPTSTQAATALEQVDYAVGVLVSQALMLQKMINELRQYMMAQDLIQETQNGSNDDGPGN